MFKEILGDLWSYPFNAGAWGTASDWLVFIVTAITANYLVKTFKSQKEIQRLQLKSTLIENERYRLENIPKFELAISNHHITPVAREYMEIQFQINITLKVSHVIL